MKDYVQAYKQNRDYCVQRLKGRTRFTQPAGAFYIFPEVPGTDREFVERAIQTRQLLIVPGRIFTERTNHVRISYATDPQTLERGIDAFLELIEER